MPSKKPFDPISSAKYMKDIGRSYWKQAVKLVSICRLFVEVGERSVSQDARLREVLAVVDDALGSARDSKTKISGVTDNKFEEAVNELIDYDRVYHSTPQDIAVIMKSAQEEDKSSSEFLNKLKESFTPVRKGPTKVFEFFLGPPGSVPDPNPVKQVLCKESNVHEILWNFSRLPDGKRITLKKNPHFYRGLSSSAPGYGGHFTTDPMLEFCFSDKTGIRVLTDERSRVFLETGRKRVFGNFWVPDEAIIFKDVCGKLEGEDVVAQDIEGTPNLWRREEPGEFPLPAGKPTTDSANPNDPQRDMVFKDWRQLVRDALNSPCTSIRISTKDTLPKDQDKSWVLSSPTDPTHLLRAQSRGPSAVASPSPERPTSITQNQNPPVAVPSLAAGATPAHPQAKPLPSTTPQSMEPPPRQAPPTGAALIRPGELTATALSQPQTAQPVIPYASAPQPALSTGGPSTVESPSPARPTSISHNHNPPVAGPPSTTAAAPTLPQARPVTPRRLDPPPRQAAPTGAAPIQPGAPSATALSQPQTAQPAMMHASAPQPALSARGPSAVVSPSPARPTSISQNQNPPVAAPPSIIAASPTQHQEIPATSQRLDPPPRQAAPTRAALIQPAAPSAMGLSPPQTVQPAMMHASAPQPALSARGPSAVVPPSPARPTSISQSQNPPVAAPPSMTAASPAQHQAIPATPQRLDPPPRQAAPTGAVPIPPTAQAPEKKKNWFQRKIWDYKGK